MHLFKYIYICKYFSACLLIFIVDISLLNGLHHLHVYHCCQVKPFSRVFCMFLHYFLLFCCELILIDHDGYTWIFYLNIFGHCHPATTFTDASLDRWFIAEDRMPEMVSWMTDLLHTTPKVYHVLDLFGGTRKVSTTFSRAGYHPTAFDIKFGADFDLTSVDGFRNLVQMTAQQLSQHWFSFIILNPFDSTGSSCNCFPIYPNFIQAL